MPRVLLLIPTRSYKAADFLAAAERLNVDVVVGSNERQTLEEVVPGHTLTLDFLNLQEATEKAVSFAQKKQIDAVVSTDEDAVLLATLISHALGLSHNPVEAVRATTDKSLLRQILTQANVPTARAACFSITDSPKEIAQKTTYPAVLKPIHLSASRGVIRANHEVEFIAAFQRIINILNDDRESLHPSRQILVESFIPGKEVALEGLLQKGVLTPLAIFDKPDPLNGPFFEETIYVTPSRLSNPLQKTIAQCTQRACAALGLREGPIHAELRINEEGPFVIEVAARSIGGLCSRTLKFGLGVSLEELILQHAVHRPIASLERQQKAAGVMMIPIPKAGVFMDIQGIEEAKKIAGIEGVVILLRRKQKVIPLPEGRRYLGFIFARGEKPAQVEQALRDAHRTLQFEIVSSGSPP